MADEQDRTIEVRGISAQTSEDTLKNYFSSTRRGGKVSDVRYDRRGKANITFAHPEGAQKALDTAPHTVEGASLTIERGRTETSEPNRVYVEGFRQETTEDGLKYFIESMCDTVEVTDVVFGNRCNAIITVGGLPDFDSIQEHCRTNSLEGNFLSTKPVPVCKTILVTNLPTNATKDSIRYKFESPRSGGGEVEDVELLLQEEAALVEFKDPSVLDTVLSRNQTLDEAHLMVRRHYSLLGRCRDQEMGRETTTSPKSPEPAVSNASAQLPGPPPALEKHTIEIDRDLYQYLLKHHPEKLNSALKNGKANEDPKGDLVVVVMETGDAADEFRHFLNDYKCEVVRFDPVLAYLGVNAKLESIREVFKSTTAVAFKENFDEGYIKIIGRSVKIHGRAVEEMSKNVKEVKEEYEETRREREDVIEIPVVQLKLLQRSEKYLESDRAWKRDNIDVRVDSTAGRIVVKGCQTKLSKVRTEVEQLVCSLGKRDLEQRLCLLLHLPAAVTHIIGLLLDDNLDVEFLSSDDNNITIHGLDETQVNKAYTIILTAIGEVTLPAGDLEPSLRSHETRAEFLDELGSTPAAVHIEGNQLKVVCLKKDVNAIREKAAQFSDRKRRIEVPVPLEKAIARYFKLHAQSVLEGLRLSSPGLSIETGPEAITISGPKPTVTSCEASILKIKRGLIFEQITFGTPETSAIITGETAHKSILGMEQTRKCAIVVNVSEEEEEHSTLGSSPRDLTDLKEATKRTLQCSYVYPNGKCIEVHQGDILDHPVDYLVNSANDEMKHSGGIAKAIVERGGHKIQEDCAKYLSEKGKSKLMPGDVVCTDGGNLICRKILHVVVPKWSSKAAEEATSEETKMERYLRHACLSALNEAKQGKTIAIPTLGTGIYSIPFAISARGLVTAADEFLKENSLSELKEVHFVDKNPLAVEALMKEMMKRYGGDVAFKINERVRSRWVELSRPNNTARERPLTSQPGSRSIRTKEGLEIRLVEGDISESQVKLQGIVALEGEIFYKCLQRLIPDVKEKTEVIVNTVDSDLNLTKNSSSKAVHDKGGPALAEQCAQWVRTNGKLQDGSFAVTSGGNLKCKKVFHLSCPRWNATNGKQKLRQILEKLFSEVKRLCLKSVAIPALGTGTLKYPEEIVAKVLLEESEKFSEKQGASGCVKRIDIIVYHGNAKVVETFRRIFTTHFGTFAPTTTLRRTRRREVENKPGHGQTTKRSNESRGEDVTAVPKELKIEVVQGNMLEESTDAIAFLVENSIRDGGQIGSALLNKAGESLEREYDGIKKIQPGSVVMTSAGNLNAKCLLHLAPKKEILQFADTGIRKILVKCLNDADSYGLKSIALPAVGTGVLGKGAKQSAEILHASISEFSKATKGTNGSLKLIRIVILQPTVFQEFRDSFWQKQRSSPTPCTISSPSGESDGNARDPRQPGSSTRVKRRIVVVDIVGENESHVKEIKKDLYQIEKEHCHSKDIVEDTIAELSPKDLDEILGFQDRYSVVIEVRQKIGYLRIHGLAQNIANAMRAIMEKLLACEKEKHSVAMSSHAVEWLYYDDNDGTKVTPEKFLDETSAEIERAYKDRKDRPTFVLTSNPDYKIDFESMVGKNVATEDTMKIYRRSREGFALPDTWELQPIAPATANEVEVHLVLIDPEEHHKEFDEVYEMFKKTMTKATVITIQRIQNPRLYQIYKGHQKKMNERGSCNEQRLFHGTAENALESIHHTGFNKAYCGRNAVRFGRGVYFARKASYSARRIYSTPTRDGGVQYMYVARVLVGQYTKGKENIIVPPPIDESNPTVTYDSVVDDVSDPGIFVVFYDYQCYPEYLITFKDETTR